MLEIPWPVVWYAAQLTVVGMGLVFLSLGIIVAVMVALTRLPWLQPKSRAEDTTAGQPVEAAPADERELVAAIAVGLALSEGQRRAARAPSSAWRMQARARQHRTRR